jgi:hypothetical protein
MDARSSRILDMGGRAVVHGHAHPDGDAGYNVSLTKLDELVARGQRAAVAQREAQVDQRTATTQKRELRRAMLLGPIAHLAGVGTLATKEDGELGKAFQVKPGVGTYARFRATAGAMQSAAEQQKEVLAKYGLSESVLEQFGKLLDQFEAAVQLGHNGRAAHKGATEELDHVATLITRTVRVMDARNRQRFEEDPQALGEWLSARQVLGTPKPGGTAPVETGSPEAPATPPVSGSGTPAGGEVRPAA